MTLSIHFRALLRIFIKDAEVGIQFMVVPAAYRYKEGIVDDGNSGGGQQAAKGIPPRATA
ncbi:hypothetical protein ABD76_23735 [Paenibacillus dendritiformis]|nr:hypothetical protein [Paenibacillus dendritiformis]